MKRTVKLLIIIFILNICLIGFGYTLSYYKEESADIKNTFIPTINSSYVINEVFEDNIKKDVTITNTGDVPSYIRVALTLNFIDEENNILPYVLKENKDYRISINENWIVKDNLYYYPYILQKGETTDSVIESLISLNEDYRLKATVLVQGISAYDLDRSADLIHLYD